MAASFSDYYQILQVPRTANADQIKQAYRRLARQHHPDLHPEKEKETHTRRMQEINEAYAVLGSPENRAKYDQYGEHWKEGPPPAQPPPQGGGENVYSGDFNAEGFSDFFRDMFGQGTRRPSGFEDFYPSELDVEAALELTLEESVKGVEKTFRLMTSGLCGNCRGTGHVGKKLCPVCGGVGEIQRPREVKTKIPAGLLQGGRIRLKGQGNEGPKGRGDLYLTIQLIPDPRFRIKGKDLESEARIMPWQAALGTELPVPTVDGAPLRVRVPKGTRAGKRLRLSGKGLGRPDDRGDLYIQLVIDIPESINPRDEALYKQLEDNNR